MKKWVYFALAGFSAAALGASGLWGLSASSGRRSEFRLLNSCYSLLTGQYLPPGSPLIAELNSGASATVICQDLIKNVYLDSQGLAAGSGPHAAAAGPVLRRMQLVHQSWFARTGFTSRDDEYATSTVVDLQSGGNYWTWLLFSEGKKAKEIFTTNMVPQALRRAQVKEQWILEPQGSARTLRRRDSREWRLQPHNITDPNGPTGEEAMGRFRPDFVPTGRLVGLRLPASRDPAASGAGFHLPLTSFGGGILTSQPYMMINSNSLRDFVTNGANAMHRRWGETVMRDFYCREMPMLEEADVTAHVVPDSKVTFQTAASCMKCHYTMDPLAAGARNLVNTLTGFTNRDPFNSRLYVKVETLAGKTTPLMLTDGDPGYGRAHPEGRLNYRDVDGRLVLFHFDTPDELGKFMGDSKDFHYCVAKRYVKYFTGYDFDVRTKPADGKPSLEFLALAERFYRHGSQKQLIGEIFASPLFTDEGMQ